MPRPLVPKNRSPLDRQGFKPKGPRGGGDRGRGGFRGGRGGGRGGFGGPPRGGFGGPPRGGFGGPPRGGFGGKSVISNNAFFLGRGRGNF